MTYSRGNVFVKPHHREHALPDFVDPKMPIRASPYHKPHYQNSSPFHKPHYISLFGNPIGVERANPNPTRVPVLEKRKMAREITTGNIGKLQPAN